MQYSKKIYLLSGITVFLALSYALTFALDPARSDARKARYTWFNAKYIKDAEDITVRGAEEDSGEVHMEKNGDTWQVLFEDKRYPAKADFIGDLFDTLSTAGYYPVRSKTDTAHKKLGVDENSAKRILIKGKSGSPLLDVLIGGTDTTGKRYMRKNGSAEVRSGEDNLRGFGAYINNYYDLRLFPDHDKEQLRVSDIQKLLVYPLPPESGAEGAEKDAPAGPWTLTRQDAEWRVEGRGEFKLNTTQVEQYARTILDALAEDFIASMNAEDESFTAQGLVPGRLIIQTGDGTERRITLGEKVNDRQAAVVSGRDVVFGLSGWTVNQLFKNYETMKAAE